MKIIEAMKWRSLDDRRAVNMKQAVIYCRVSTKRQSEEGVSMESQADKGRAYCAFNGFEVIATVDEPAKSGASTSKRPMLKKAIEAACKAKGVLVVYSLSRMARSTRDAINILEQLKKSGADLASVTEQINTTTAAGEMFYQLLAVFAEFERKVIKERTRAALEHKRRNGEKTGGSVPFGYDAVKTEDGRIVLALNEAEQSVICEIMDLAASGAGATTVSEHLNDSGRKTKTGRQWTAKIVKKVYDSEMKRLMDRVA